MVMIQRYLLCTLLLLCASPLFSQQQHFRFRQQLEEHPDVSMAFAVTNTPGLLEKLLREKSISVKSVTPQWIYIQATPKWMDEAQTSKLIEQFHYELSLPVALNDTSRTTHFVNQVHNGEFGLQTPFTGKGVVIGYVDQGLDFTHPDFIDENGQTRVLYYWDHTLPYSVERTPQPYNYGQAWNSNDIQSGICTSTEESSAHGTSVIGAGSADGSANGLNKGMAPDSKIIIVETNFNLANWTLTVADACDFIFKKAEELGMPAVVNLSVGDYLGSHDGNDPASVLIEQLLDEKPGRIVVCAAGNSGAWGKYHVHDEPDGNTSFTWFRNNPSGALGANTIYFDVWADAGIADWTYALGANLNNGSYAERATTVFRTAGLGAGTTVYDTLYNSNGDRLATIELYPSIVNSNLHLEVFFSHVDSTSYYYSFKTTGAGSYDLWSGATMGLNAIVETLPTAAVYPPIVHYNMPDTLQTIVSSWNCSEKVISVGNVRNRFGHIDKNGNYYQPAPTYTAAVHQLSPNSAKGPNRHGITKPDVSASGDVALSAGPLWLLNNAAYNSLIDAGGFHVRNGGTSMASPVVAGIAALYLEKCHNGTYQSFKNDLMATAFTDGFTGAVPNNAYGYGKIHALNLLLESNYATGIGVPTQYCSATDTIYSVLGFAPDSIVWNTGSTQSYTTTSASTGPYYYISYNDLGCVGYSDTVNLVMGDIPPTPEITVAGPELSTDPYPNLQWYENGVAIPGATGTSININLPSSSDFTVVATGTTGCEATSEIYNPSAGINENTLFIGAYPNPTDGLFTIETSFPVEELLLFDLQGNKLKTLAGGHTEVDLRGFASGTYFVLVRSGEQFGWTKIVKN